MDEIKARKNTRFLILGCLSEFLYRHSSHPIHTSHGQRSDPQAKGPAFGIQGIEMIHAS